MTKKIIQDLESWCKENNRLELLEEWDYSKNKALFGVTPRDVGHGAVQKYWWICKKGHSFDTPPNSRTGKSKNGCRYCGGKEVLKGETDLATLLPDLANEWHPYKNGALKPCDFTIGSSRKVWWKCKECGHEWEAVIHKRTYSKRGCPECVKGKSTSFPEQFLYFCLKLKFNDTQNRYKINNTEYDIYIPSIDMVIEYDGGRFHKHIQNIKEHKKFEETIKQGLDFLVVQDFSTSSNLEFKDNIISYDYRTKNINHEKEKEVFFLIIDYINNKYKKKKSKNLPNNINSLVLENTTVNKKKESIVYTHPQLVKEWHHTKNGKLKPIHISPGSKRKVWWLCEKGHTYLASVQKRTQDRGCPYCSNRMILVGYNDLATVNPKLAEEWHPTKNGNLTPQDVVYGSSRKVWWQCEEGHEWEAPIFKRNNRGDGCQICYYKNKKTNISKRRS